MSTSVDGSRTATSDELLSGTHGRDVPRVVWLARIGVLFALLQAYIYGRWIFSDQFTPAPTGSDPLPVSQKFWTRCWDIASIAACVGFLIWIVWKTVRDRAMPTLGIVTIAWMLTAQLPLFEPLVFGGFVGTVAAAIYYFRDANGHMFTDTGLGKLTIKRGRTTVRVLALCTVPNVLMLVFNMGWNMVNQHADTTPTHVPSYFSSELCGLGASSACPPPK